MASLKPVEKDCFEDLLQMRGGYVLNFVDRTFAEFFRSVASVDIDTPKYSFNGSSKANRLRAFWEVESDPLVGTVLVEMLEKWKYEQERLKQPYSGPTFDRCRKTVNRLIGKKENTEPSEDDFLERDFGNITIATLPVESAVQPVLENRIAEALRCLKADAPLAVIFLCGSVLEGALLGIAQKNPEKFNRAKASPKDKQGRILPFNCWSLAALINVSTETEFLTLDVKKFSHALRDFRNYIHPYEQMVSGFTPTAHTARICVQVMKAALASLCSG